MSSEIVSSELIRDEAGNVVAVRVVREAPDGTRAESTEPLEVESPARPFDPREEYEDYIPESLAERVWRER